MKEYLDINNRDKKYDDLYKNIDNYIDFAKSDLLIFCFLHGILIIIILCISINFYEFLFCLLFPIEFIKSKIKTYFNTKKIVNYIYDNNLRDKIGNVDYWNERNYIFCENFIFYCKSSYWKRKVYAIKYKDIKEMNVISDGRIGWSQDYLVMKTKDGKEYKILVYSPMLTGYLKKDVSLYILNKNPKIKYNPKTKYVFWIKGKD